MKKIYEEKKDGIHLLFFLSKPSNISYLKEYVKEICGQVIISPILKRFRRMEVVIHNDEVLEKQIRSYSWDFYQKMWRGYTEKKLIKGKNRININEEVVIAFRYLMRRRKGNLKITDISWSNICTAASKDAVGIIVHEIAHLWHLRRNPTKKLIKRQLRRFNKAYYNSLRNAELFKGDENIAECWGDLRTNLFTLMDQIVTEGFAAFHESLANGTIKYTKKSLVELYKYVKGVSSSLNKDLEEVYEEFSRAVESGSYVKISKVKAKFGKVTKLVPQHCNTIGMHLHHVVLYTNEDITDEEIVHFSPEKLIKNYEQSCKSLGWQPVISIGTEGIFSLKKHISHIHSFRKSSE